jgi:putative drug exporter of the RND superfamily
VSTDLDTAPSAAPSAGRRRFRWLLPAILFLVWMVVGGIGGPFAGKLAEVQKNDASSFLPASAESQKVSELAKKFTSAQSYPAFVLIESDRALTPQTLAAAKAFAADLPGLEIPVDGAASRKVSDFLTPGVVPVVPAQDGKAALLLVNFDIKGVGITLADGQSPILRSVEVIRDQEKKLETGGVQVYVAGPGGQLADLVKVFGGIDGVLLLVALVAVLFILLVVYRSPVVPFLVIFSAVFALALASVVVYFLAKNDVLTLDGQGQGILSILVVGAATDYALLLVARYREELRRHDDRFDAMRLAWRRTVEPVVASAGTVILGLLCLLLADLGPTKGLGPVGAIGVGSAMLAALTFLPAVLLLPGRTSSGEHGRWIFWPDVPHVGTPGAESKGIWARISRLVGEHPRRVWVVTGLALLAMAAFVPTFKAEGIKSSDLFLSTVESVTGNDELAKHFPAGSGTPTIVVGPAAKAGDLVTAIGTAPGVASAFPVTDQPVDPAAAANGGPAPAPKVVDGLVQFQVTLTDPADSPAADDTVRGLRTDLDKVSKDALVGGLTAANLDVRTISTDDRNRIIPIVLLVIFVVLALLLRALVAPIVLIIANVLSFGATLGVSALVFNHVFHFPGADPGIPLYGFVFLVALGIDYSIFLMTRVREESLRIGTRPGILLGLAVTGGVITSAGVVLASTFAALGVLPILFLAQIAFIVAFGVLLDTLVVRSLLVPALSHDIGARIWLPSKLARTSRTPD